MARSFGNNPANYLSRSTSLIASADPRPISLGLWLKAANRGTSHVIFSNSFNNQGPNCLMLLGDAGGGQDEQKFYSGGYAGDSTPFTLSTTTWTHLGWTWTSAGDAVGYFLNGAANGTSSKALAGNDENGAAIGTLDGALANWDVDGSLAEFAVWNAILTASEWAALGKGFSPLLIRPASLVSYLPIFGSASPEVDRIDGASWTINGTLTKSDHTGMIYPSGARTCVRRPAAGGAITGSTSVTLTATGAVTGGDALAGSMSVTFTATATLRKKIVGPYRMAAAQTYQAGAAVGELFTAKAAAGEIFSAGAVAAQLAV